MLVVFLNFVIKKKNNNYVHKREKEKTIKIEILVSDAKNKSFYLNESFS